MIKDFCFAISIIGIVFSTSTQASVVLPQGSYSAAFIDIKDVDGTGLDFKRVYHSKSGFKGFFGEGWRSEYETSLILDADGSVVINESGEETAIRFTSGAEPANALEAGIKQILEARAKASPALSPEGRSILKDQLIKSEALRQSTYKSLVSQGKIAKPLVAEGKSFTSTQAPQQRLIKTKDGFERKYPNGQSQAFSESGKLIQIKRSEKHFIQLSYNPLNLLSEITNDQNKKLKLTYNDEALLEKVSSSTGKHSEYRYSKSGFLKGAKDSNGVGYAFEYSPDTYRNLAKIVYLEDKDEKNQPKEISIRYFGQDQEARVREVKELNGSLHSYEYFYRPEKNGTQTVRKIVTTSKGKKTTTHYTK